MAIIAEEVKKPFNWFAAISIVVIAAIIGALVYYLFFAPTPAIELITPAALKEASQILTSPLDVNATRNHRVFKLLKPYVSPLTVSRLGRENPFTPF